MSEAAMNEADVLDDFTVQLTDEEWGEQDRLLVEYLNAITGRDRKRADELRPQIVFASFHLKWLKKLMGASHIRKEGYNTIDADLAYGPDWLDEDDGGPECMYSEDYKPLGEYELPRSWREP